MKAGVNKWQEMGLVTKAPTRGRDIARTVKLNTQMKPPSFTTSRFSMNAQNAKQ